MNPEALLAFAIPFALIAAGLGILTKIAGAKWILGLFESEGQPSARIVLGCTVIVFTLFMQAADRISDNKVEANYFLAGTLLGLGTAKLIATRFAQRPSAPAATITAKKAEGNAENATVTTPANDQPPA